MTAEVPGLAVLAAALLVWPPADAPVRARVQRLRGTLPRAAPGRRGVGGSRLLRWVLPVAAGLGCAVLVGGAGGVLAGLVVAGGALGMLSRAARTAGDDGAVTRELPVACDLLAVCLAAGVPVGSALAAVAGAVGDPLRPELAHVAALYRLGAEPGHAWAGVPAPLAPLGRAVARAGMSGSAIGGALRALAGDVRAAQRTRGEAAVRRAGVWVLAPLGACFLPAFVCLGVVPLVLGLAAGVLG